MPTIRSVSCGLDLASGDRAVAAGPLSASSAAAFETARRVARAEGASLHLVTALDLDEHAAALLGRAKGRRTVADEARDRLEALASQARQDGVAADVEVAAGAPAAALLADADRNARGLIVVGTRERGVVARHLLGSTALKLLRRAAQPVWVARSPLRDGPVVLAAVTLEDMGWRVVSAAARVAAHSGGTLHVVHVVDFRAEDVLRAGAADETIVREYRQERREHAEKAVPRIVAQGVADAGAALAAAPVVHLPDGDTAATIVATAGRVGADLVVAGSVRHGVVEGLVTGLGRTAEAILGDLRTSLLVLKPQRSGS